MCTQCAIKCRAITPYCWRHLDSCTYQFIECAPCRPGTSAMQSQLFLRQIYYYGCLCHTAVTGFVQSTRPTWPGLCLALLPRCHLRCVDPGQSVSSPEAASGAYPASCSGASSTVPLLWQLQGSCSPANFLPHCQIKAAPGRLHWEPSPAAHASCTGSNSACRRRCQT